MTERAVLAIDPGPAESAFVIYLPERPVLIANPDGSRTQVGGYIADKGILPNGLLLGSIRQSVGSTILGGYSGRPRHLAVEMVEGLGMPVGATVFSTVFWTGRFYEAGDRVGMDVTTIKRKAAKIAVCGTSAAKDANVRQAIMDRYGGDHAKGTKANPGPLYGVARDIFAALAVAIAWSER